MIQRDLRQIAYAAEVGTQIGVTLYFPGMIISGLVVSRKEWFEAYVRRISDGFTGGGAETNLVLSWTIEQQTTILTAEPAASASIKLIHLRDALIFLDGASKAIGSPYWRGNIASAFGWHFGQLAQQTTD